MLVCAVCPQFDAAVLACACTVPRIQAAADERLYRVLQVLCWQADPPARASFAELHTWAQLQRGNLRAAAAPDAVATPRAFTGIGNVAHDVYRPLDRGLDPGTAAPSEAGGGVPRYLGQAPHAPTRLYSSSSAAAQPYAAMVPGTDVGQTGV